MMDNVSSYKGLKMSVSQFGMPPASVTYALRFEGFVAFLAALATYQVLGGGWWIFVLLFLLPDLSMLGMLRGPQAGVRAYNIAHTYTLPAALVAIGWAFGSDWTISVAIIWVAHIGFDRAVGYGLKYPQSFHHTHLGIMGKAKNEETEHANAS